MKALLPMTNGTKFERIIALDIETASDGKLLDIGCYTEHFEDSEPIYQTFKSWKKFFEWLLNEEGKIRIIAHNGFGFDYVSFNQWFLKHRTEYGFIDEDITYLSSESLLIALILKQNGNEYTFLDTMRYFPGQSLQKLAESFLGESKDDVPDDYISHMEDYKKRHRILYYKYLRQDCELLYKIYQEFRREINEFTEIGELGMSSGSTAMKSFRRWLHTNYPKTRIFSAPEEYQQLADYALRGGLTLYIGDGKHTDHLYEDVYHYDVISMYPSVMRSIPTPSSPMVYTQKVVKDFDQYRPGWYLCNFEQTKGRVPFLFAIDSEYPVWKGQGILSHYEMEFLESYGRYEIQDGVVYEDFIFPFSRYYENLLELRLSAKNDGQSAKAHALKILANSLYGKFGQKSTREIISITSDRDWYETFLEAQLRDNEDSGVTEYVVERDYILYGVQSQSTAFSNRFVGAMVTSLARLKLGLLLNTYASIYCDTDSIFTQTQMDECFIGTSPGDFEQSLQSPNTLICLGKKSYQYGDDIKFKGVPSKNLTEDDMNLMRYGTEINVEYKSPTAWKTAMKQGTINPNQFLPRSRRVKRGNSLLEMGLLHPNEKLFKASETKAFLDSLLHT